MTMQRKPYLVTKSLKNYLLSAVIALAVNNVNLLIDGILMGNFLGPENLAAINLSLPVVNCVLSLSTLLTAGGVMIAARSLGKMNRKRLYEVFTISSLAVWFIALMLSFFSKTLCNFAVNLLTSEKTLIPLCEKYIRVLMMGSISLMYTNTLGMYLNVSGHPKAVTFGMCMSVIINILMDIVLVRVLNMGIGGSALATVLGNIACIIFFALFIFKKKNLLKFTFRIRCPFRDLGEIIVKSIAETIADLSVVALQLICNSFIQAKLGAEGMFVLSIGYSILGISIIVSTGMNTSFTAIGGSMMGQKDYRGIRFLLRRGMSVCLFTGILFFIVSLIFPRQLAILFGADTEELTAMAVKGIPLITTYILSLTLTMPFSAYLQVIGRFGISAAVNISLLLSVFTGCVLADNLMPPEDIWYAFPLTCFLCLFSLFFFCLLGKISSKTPVTFPDLIPVKALKNKHFDLSVACNEESLNEAIEKLWDYLNTNHYGKISCRIAHSVEELLLNTIQHSNDTAHFVDVLIGEDNSEITVLLKDDGLPFDTSSCLSEQKKNGLKLAHHFCGSISYNYTFGQNITLMSWSLK